jgi:hemerythrin-like domain-containing protein
MSETTVSLADSGLFCFLDDCHAAIGHKLRDLDALAAAAELGDFTPEQQAQARGLVDWFNSEARQHHLDEEKHVFPTLLASADANITQITHRLIQDHGWLEADWLEIEPALSAAAEGSGWFDPAVLRQAVEIFHQLYLDHIVLEESLAYPQARERINPQLLQAMEVEMVARRAVRQTQASAN